MDSILSTLSRENFVPGTLSSPILHAIGDALTGDYANEVHWLADRSKFFSFTGNGNYTLQGYYIPPQESSNDSKLPILYIHGFTESVIKYSRVFRSLHEFGHPVYAFDAYGHGFSESIIIDNERWFHMDYDDYPILVGDVEIMMNNYVLKDPASMKCFNETNCNEEKNRAILIANSFGACIGLSYAVNHPEMFKNIIVASPYFDPGMKEPVKTISKSAVRLARNLKAYLSSSVGMSLAGNRGDIDIKNLELTTDKYRLETWIQLRNLLRFQFYITGPTAAGAYVMLDMQTNLYHRLSELKSPVLIFLPGSDTFVDMDATYRNIRKMNNVPLLKVITYRDGYHELFWEIDSIFKSIVLDTQHFIDHY